MKSEAEVQQYIQMEAAKHKCILMRNNSGALKDAEGRLVRYGLGNISRQFNEKMKSSDLIGIEPVLIRPEMVGSIIGRFTACEVKPPDWKFSESDKRAVAQLNFINFINARGGRAGFARSEAEFLEIIKG